MAYYPWVCAMLRFFAILMAVIAWVLVQSVRLEAHDAVRMFWNEEAYAAQEMTIASLELHGIGKENDARRRHARSTEEPL